MGIKTEQSKTAYNRKAFQYDSTYDGRYTKIHKARLLDKAWVKDGNRVLDVACGNGTFLSALSKKAKIHAYGLDLSENMIAVARKRCPEGTFTVGECIPLNFENDSLDIVTVSAAFHHFENPREFVNECKRVLKQSGRVCMAEPNFPSVVRWIANRLIFPFSKAGDVKVYSERELSEFFVSAGFKYTETNAKGSVTILMAIK